MMRQSFIAGLLTALIGVSGCTSLSKIGQVIMDPSVPVGANKDQPTQVAFSINASPTLNGNPHSLEVAGESAPVVEPSPYAVSLSAADPYVLIEKVGVLFEHLQAEFPAISPVLMEEDDDPATARSPLEESTPGSYGDPTVVLTLPRAPAVASSEPVATPMAIKILQLRDDSLLRNSVYELLDKNPAKTLRSTYIRDDDYLLRPGQFKFIPFVDIDPETRFVAVIADYRNQQDATWQQVLQIPPRGRQIILSVLLNDAQVLLKEED